MNTIKIFSILLFALFAFGVSFFIAQKMLLPKRKEELPFERVIMLSSTFVGISIILNLVFQKINFVYDLIDQYSFDFQKVFEIKSEQYGYSIEMLKISTIYIAIAFAWLILAILFSKVFAKRFFNDTEWQYHTLKSIIFICLAIAFYPVLSFIIDNFYVVLTNPIIK